MEDIEKIVDILHDNVELGIQLIKSQDYNVGIKNEILKLYWNKYNNHKTLYSVNLVIQLSIPGRFSIVLILFPEIIFTAAVFICNSKLESYDKHGIETLEEAVEYLVDKIDKSNIWNT